VSVNAVLRFISAVLAVCMAVVSANYYLNLGWFGPTGKPLVSIMTLVGAVFLFVALRMWRRD
jgi:hypothetical protein